MVDRVEVSLKKNEFASELQGDKKTKRDEPEISEELVVFFKLMIAGHKPV